MSAKAELKKAHDELAAILDIKLAEMPEWRAFRAVNRALIAIDDVSLTERARQEGFAVKTGADGVRRIRLLPTYARLTEQAIGEFNRPVTTTEVMDYIGKRRTLDDDHEKAKINVTSSLSKSDRIESVPWRGGRGWWLKGRPIPAPDPELPMRRV
jgi:hypothetical protein